MQKAGAKHEEGVMLGWMQQPLESEEGQKRDPPSELPEGTGPAGTFSPIKTDFCLPLVRVV